MTLDSLHGDFLHGYFLHGLERDGRTFADLAASIDLDGPVPTCPQWTVADLVFHLGEVHHFWTTVVVEALVDPNSYSPPDRPSADRLVDWYSAGVDRMVGALRDAPADTDVWTWWGDGSPAAITRRMAHETAMHHSDLLSAAGQPLAIDPTLASDGIDEFLHRFLPSPWSGATASAVGGSVHIHCGDVAGEWTICSGPDDGFVVTREHAKGDCALRGAASDLLLVLWRRLPLSAVDVVGDAEVAARFVMATGLD